MKPNPYIKKFTAYIYDFPSLESFAKEERPLEKAKNIVRYLYYFLALKSTTMLFAGDTYFGASENFSPVWSTLWVNLLSPADAITIIQFFFLASAFIGSFFYWNRIARIIAFLGVFELHALLSSFGIEVDHAWYPWLFVTFFLIFLPDTRAQTRHSLEGRKKFLLVFLAVQASVFFTYSMSGFGKIYGAINQIIDGGIHAFAPEALALHVAHWLASTDSVSLLGPFIIDHPWFGWPLFVGTIYLQFFALWILFKPSLHKLWAAGLVFSHIGIYVIMGLTYLSSAPLLILLFFDSPFHKPGTSWRKILLDLPIFGSLLRLFTDFRLNKMKK